MVMLHVNYRRASVSACVFVNIELVKVESDVNIELVSKRITGFTAVSVCLSREKQIPMQQIDNTCTPLK